MAIMKDVNTDKLFRLVRTPTFNRDLDDLLAAQIADPASALGANASEAVRRAVHDAAERVRKQMARRQKAGSSK